MKLSAEMFAFFQKYVVQYSKPKQRCFVVLKKSERDATLTVSLLTATMLQIVHGEGILLCLRYNHGVVLRSCYFVGGGESILGFDVHCMWSRNTIRSKVYEIARRKSAHLWCKSEAMMARIQIEG